MESVEFVDAFLDFGDLCFSFDFICCFSRHIRIDEMLRLFDDILNHHFASATNPACLGKVRELGKGGDTALCDNINQILIVNMLAAADEPASLADQPVLIEVVDIYFFFAADKRLDISHIYIGVDPYKSCQSVITDKVLIYPLLLFGADEYLFVVVVKLRRVDIDQVKLTYFEHIDTHSRLKCFGFCLKEMRDGCVGLHRTLFDMSCHITKCFHLGTLSYGIDILIIRLHKEIGQNPPIASQGISKGFNIGPDAHTEDEKRVVDMEFLGCQFCYLALFDMFVYDAVFIGYTDFSFFEVAGFYGFDSIAAEIFAIEMISAQKKGYLLHAWHLIECFEEFQPDGAASHDDHLSASDTIFDLLAITRISKYCGIVNLVDRKE